LNSRQATVANSPSPKTDKSIRHASHDADVQDNGNPEHDAERHLLRLVPKLSLAEKCTGPATKKGQQVQCAFGDSTISGGGSSLVRPVCKEGSETHDENDEQVNGDGDIHALWLAFCWVSFRCYSLIRFMLSSANSAK